MHEEEQHIDIREKLLNLPKVKASDDFMNTLQRKINLAEAESTEKKITDEVKESIWVKLFGKKKNPWLIPSLSLTIVAVLIVSIYVLNSGKINDVPTISDFQKKETTVQPNIQESTPKIEDKEKSLEKSENITGRMDETGTEKNFQNIEKESKEKINPPPVPSEINSDEFKAPAPKKIDELNFETGKSAIEDVKKSEDADKRVMEKSIAPMKKSEVKSQDVEQKINSEETTKEVIEGRGLIENEKKDKKAKMPTKKTAKTTTDSTKIDKKILEKIKEEIEKSSEENK